MKRIVDSLKALMALLLLLTTAIVGRVSAQTEGLGETSTRPNDPLQRELDFCQGLVGMRFADYAMKILDHLERESPDQKARIARVRVAALTALGKAEEAKALIGTFPPDRIETMAMLLALADQLYAMNRLADARALYQSFFNRFSKEGPPPDWIAFFRESAYKYAQMMLLAGNEKEAMEAYERILRTKPEPDIERRLQIEIAELAFKLGQAAQGKEREAYFARTRELCRQVQWGGIDLWFGQSVVLLAHLEVMDGKPEKARETIQTYLPMLRELDEALRAANYPMKLSPMAQCRYILGTLYEEEGRRLLAEGQRAEAQKAFSEALTHLYNVFVRYPDSTWAPDAGARSERMAEELKTAGFKVQLPQIDLKPVIDAQVREARLQFSQNDFKSAAAKYRTVLNVFPERPGTAALLGELAQCYLNLQDTLYMQAVVQELTDRYAYKPAFREEAGTALIRLAAAAEEIQDNESAERVSRLFFERFPNHPQVASLLFKRGEDRFAKEQYDLALEHFSRIAESYTNASAWLPALNRLAACYVKLGDWTNAAGVLKRYVAEVPVGAAQASGRFRLAEALRQLQQFDEAIREYQKLIKALIEEPRKYASTPEEESANRVLLEQAMFWKAVCYSRLNEPPEKKPLYQARSVEEYEAFLKAFPRSSLAPSALSSMGVLLLVLNRSEEAAAVYERLSREFPDSEQARNAVFARGSALLDMGERGKAVAVFQEMFDRPSAFSAAQFYQAGRVMADQGEAETAIRAFRQAAQTAGEANLKEMALFALGEVLVKKEDWAGAVRELEALFALNPNTGYLLPASFLLARAHAALGEGASDERTRGHHFNAAIRALNRASRVIQTPEDRARRDLEMATLQKLKGDSDGAVASYQRLVLLGDVRNPKVRPFIEQAFEAVMPLLLERGFFQDMVDNANLYLENFPRGRLVTQARQWRADAQRRLALSGGALPAPSEEGQTPPAESGTP
jgi:tetratricopeptide (TPR) repeat protein